MKIRAQVHILENKRLVSTTYCLCNVLQAISKNVTKVIENTYIYKETTMTVFLLH